MSSDTDSALATDPTLAGVLEELKGRELILHRPEMGTTRADLDRLIAPDFWEVGASGQRYGRNAVIDVLERRSLQPDPNCWETCDFRCQLLASEVYLLTYTLRQVERVTRRVSVWRRTGQGWKVLFHQGTVVQHP